MGFLWNVWIYEWISYFDHSKVMCTSTIMNSINAALVLMINMSSRDVRILRFSFGISKMELRNQFLKLLTIKVWLSLLISITSQGIFTQGTAEGTLLCGIEESNSTSIGHIYLVWYLIKISSNFSKKIQILQMISIKRMHFFLVETTPFRYIIMRFTIQEVHLFFWK